MRELNHRLAMSRGTRKRPKTAVGKAIDQFCKDQRITHREIAEVIKVSPSLVSCWRKGTKLPGPESIAKLRTIPELSAVLDASLRESGVHPVADQLNQLLNDGRYDQDIRDELAANVNVLINAWRFGD